MRISATIILALLIASLSVAPVTAGEKFLYGSPSLSVAISGTNQFAPGAEVQLPIVIQNSGLNELKIVDPTIITREDQPNTAKLVTVNLSKGNAPVTIKTDPQMIGDVAGGASATATFTVLIAKDALAGTYVVPLTLTYTYLETAEQYGTDSMRYMYREKTISAPLKVTVTSNARLAVLDAEVEHLNVGTEGFLTLTLKNTGSEHATKTVAKVARNDNSPLTPTDSSVYIGDFAPGSTATCTYKVSVSSNAEAQVYPLNVLLEYEKEDGTSAQSDTVTIGVPVGGKIEFAVVSTGVSAAPGERKVIEVQYKNVGAATAYNAQARLSAVDPFTSGDDTAYLGDMAPGQTSTARFEVSVDAGATEKDYGLDSEIRYRDALDNSQISDTMKVTIGVVSQEGVAGLLGNPIVLAVIAAGLIGSGYYVLRLRKKGGSS
ncbi:MAG: S-layer protein [Methanobacteriota archaeon]|nr:MAG: S-layer protein [Euryarchaeota archaeon]